MLNYYDYYIVWLFRVANMDLNLVLYMHLLWENSVEEQLTKERILGSKF